MSSSRDIYYISGNTTFLAKDMGKALLSQFPDKSFNEESIPFIRDEADAQQALRKILQIFRNIRFPNSSYALLETCENEVALAERILKFF
jgi:regulator of PEP synthase PpsR (kinase-PPPase family)